jgi:hypothetical protein
MLKECHFFRIFQKNGAEKDLRNAYFNALLFYGHLIAWDLGENSCQKASNRNKLW